MVCKVAIHLVHNFETQTIAHLCTAQKKESVMHSFNASETNRFTRRELVTTRHQLASIRHRLVMMRRHLVIIHRKRRKGLFHRANNLSTSPEAQAVGSPPQGCGKPSMPSLGPSCWQPSQGIASHLSTFPRGPSCWQPSSKVVASNPCHPSAQAVGSPPKE